MAVVILNFDVVVSNTSMLQVLSFAATLPPPQIIHINNTFMFLTLPPPNITSHSHMLTTTHA